MNFALIKDNVVNNIIVADNDPEFLEILRVHHNCDEVVEAKENCEIGGTYENGIFNRKPVEEVPVLPVVEE
jgi:hypothetical protein